MKNEEKRQKLVQAAVAFTKGTLAEAGEYEQYLLEKFVRGVLTIEEVITLLEVAKPPS